MKQIIKLLMVMLMLGGVACTTNDLDGGNQDNNDTNELHNQIWYTATEEVIPSAPIVFGANIVSNVWNETTGEGVITFDGEVTSIGERAFYNCSSLTSITIPDSVTEIGAQAFRYCTSLASITIPDGVTSIGEGAFCYCMSLTSITIPEGVTSIGNNAFYYCSSLEGITIPDGVTSIGYSAFSGCESLAEFNGKYASEDGRCLIVDGVLNSFAPYGLTEYTIPDGVTSIGDGAFSSCSSLASVTIPDSVTEIGSLAFCYCFNLRSVTIGNGVTSIVDSAFRDCSSLESITIPAGVTSIGDWAFNNCSSLAEVYCKPTTPPMGGVNMFANNASELKIYVPAESLEAYKTAEGWSDYADAIEGYAFE